MPRDHTWESACEFAFLLLKAAECRTKQGYRSVLQSKCKSQRKPVFSFAGTWRIPIRITPDLLYGPVTRGRTRSHSPSIACKSATERT